MQNVTRTEIYHQILTAMGVLAILLAGAGGAQALLPGGPKVEIIPVQQTTDDAGQNHPVCTSDRHRSQSSSGDVPAIDCDNQSERSDGQGATSGA